MTEFITRENLARVAAVVAAPQPVQPHVREAIDRSFELPVSFYIATVALYLGFLGVMAVSFMNPELALPMAIFAVAIIAGFGTPTLWVRMRPENRQRLMRYGTFRYRGIETATGHLAGGAAAVQVLMLPLLIFCWGVAVAVIAALTH
jgi:hypothetical protein